MNFMSWETCLWHTRLTLSRLKQKWNWLNLYQNVYVRAVIFKQHITVPTYSRNNLVESEQRTSADLLCNAFQHILECYSCSEFVLLTKNTKQPNKKWHPCKVDWKWLISLPEFTYENFADFLYVSSERFWRGFTLVFRAAES